jgi:hypothetical protein
VSTSPSGIPGVGSGDVDPGFFAFPLFVVSALSMLACLAPLAMLAAFAGLSRFIVLTSFPRLVVLGRFWTSNRLRSLRHAGGAVMLVGGLGKKCCLSSLRI